jgi:DNA-binding HxlR family transcriptional regulator
MYELREFLTRMKNWSERFHRSLKMLTQQLRQVESEGLVHRAAHRQVPPKVEYALTVRGTHCVRR